MFPSRQQPGSLPPLYLSGGQEGAVGGPMHSRKREAPCQYRRRVCLARSRVGQKSHSQRGAGTWTVHQCGSCSNPDCMEAEKHCHSPMLFLGHQRHSPGTGKGACVLSAFCLPTESARPVHWCLLAQRVFLTPCPGHRQPHTTEKDSDKPRESAKEAEPWTLASMKVGWVR